MALRPTRRVLDLLERTVVIAAAAAIVFSVYRQNVVTRSLPDGGAPTRRPPDPPVPKSPVSFSTSPVRGNRQAKVGLIEYAEFQCPFCKSFYLETFPELDEKYLSSGKALFAFKEFPLPQHQAARPAAVAALCAAQHQKFWEFHDSLFKAPTMSTALVSSTAATLKLDQAILDNCLKSSEARVDEDIASGKAIDVRGTPNFLFGFVEGGANLRVVSRFSGARPFDAFEKVIEDLLASVPSR